MTVADQELSVAEGSSSGKPYIVVSADSHAGPPLAEHLRVYCPKEYLPEFDDYSRRAHERPELVQLYEISGRLTLASGNPDPVPAERSYSGLDPEARHAGIESLRRIHENRGSYEAEIRLRHMDEDGVAASLIFAGAQNSEVLPWAGGFDAGDRAVDPSLRALGGHIWNEWLADFCKADPVRLLGVMQIPIFDVEAAVREIKWGAANGLKAINLPAPRPDYPTFNMRVYDSLWEAAEDSGLALVTHVASGEAPSSELGVGALMLFQSEMLWLSRRGLAQLIFGQVFDRFPGLRVGYIEQRAHWVAEHLKELDEAYFGLPTGHVLSVLGYPIEAPKLSPSEYWRRNCFVGASAMAPFEAQASNEAGLETVMWGDDYPHLEGTWPRTRLAMRNTFAGMAEDDVRAILGANGVRLLGLDEDALQAVADRIGPRPEDLASPLSPEDFPAYLGQAFRTKGAFH
jgi:predicted TIM-barrel fold metal-dependent hydrolase